MGHGEGAGEGSPGASRDAALLALVQIAREPLAETLACAYLGWSVADLHGALDRSAGVVVRDAAGRIAPAPAARDDAPLTPEHARDHHRDLASWCGRDLATIWERSDEPQEEARRAYGRRHYVTHLALGEQWDTLWLVLDDERYARGKQAGLDSGTLAYARDLDRARAAAACCAAP